MCLSILWNWALKQAEAPTHFHRLSRDTNTFQSSPRKTCLVLTSLRSSISAAKTALPRSPSTAGVGGIDPCASVREHLRCWVFLWLQNMLLMQLKDFWILVLLVLFQPESADISSQTSCIQPEQCKGILRGYNLFLKQEQILVFSELGEILIRCL